MDIFVRHLYLPRINADGNGFAFVGKFSVTALFGEGDVSQFEYRQYIKGSCTLQYGSFRGNHPTINNWVAPPLRQNGNHLFAIPGGLHTHYTEDGEIINGRSTYFGHRTNPSTQSYGLEDRYIPNQPTGNQYVNLDTYGIRGTSRTSGLRIQYHLFYMGTIINNITGNTHKYITWDINADNIIP